MAIETIRGRYRLHRFPPRQRHLQAEQLTPGITPADYQRQLMDGFQEGLQKGFEQGMTEGQEQAFRKVIRRDTMKAVVRDTLKAAWPGNRKGVSSLSKQRNRWKPSLAK
ncbi:MAG: Lateral flagellar export/assembly protein (FliH-like) [Citrobacter braakii]|jgi:flagellar assembly protein FliH